MPDNGFSDAPVGGPVMPCPNKPPHWVEIQLEDQDGHRVPNEEFLLITPDGTPVGGYLDSNGWARLDLTAAGTCKVSFPNLDKTLWKYDHSAGPAT